jgi:hypothetical protein
MPLTKKDAEIKTCSKLPSNVKMPLDRLKLTNKPVEGPRPLSFNNSTKSRRDSKCKARQLSNNSLPKKTTKFGPNKKPSGDVKTRPVSTFLRMSTKTVKLTLSLRNIKKPMQLGSRITKEPRI